MPCWFGRIPPDCPRTTPPERTTSPRASATVYTSPRLNNERHMGRPPAEGKMVASAGGTAPPRTGLPRPNSPPNGPLRPELPFRWTADKPWEHQSTIHCLLAEFAGQVSPPAEPRSAHKEPL